ncbi:MAG: DNA-3-methyladenine glycosylase 2 family protein [Bacteroidetes bacterium]|nr:DNA-3-methyladenine glycosylase 2 family protein [Bacteroidota bacterium]
METFTPDNFHAYCDQLAESDTRIEELLHTYGYPPCWQRSLSFSGLLLTILEQQVSLASAKHAYKKLENLLEEISPERVNALPDHLLKKCGFSRQKTRYAKELARHILEGKVSLEAVPQMPDEIVRLHLTQVPGIGNWTANIVLLMMLNRLDVFPIGDLALRKSMIAHLDLPKKTDHETLLAISEDWKPLRSVACMLFWHRYLSIS